MHVRIHNRFKDGDSNCSYRRLWSNRQRYCFNILQALSPGLVEGGRRCHRLSQDSVCGCSLFSLKSRRPFLVVAFKSKDGLKLLIEAPNLPRTANNVLKIDSCSVWGCTWCAGVAITNFPCKLRLKFFLCFGGCRCTHCTPGYAYGRYMGSWGHLGNGNLSLGSSSKPRWEYRDEVL